MTWTTRDVDTDLHHYFLNGIRLDLDFDNSSWIRKIPNFATNNINIFSITTDSPIEGNELASK